MLAPARFAFRQHSGRSPWETRDERILNRCTDLHANKGGCCCAHRCSGLVVERGGAGAAAGGGDGLGPDPHPHRGAVALHRRRRGGRAVYAERPGAGLEEIHEMLAAGGSDIQFQLVIEDTRTTPEGALAAIESLAAAGVQVVIGPYSS